MAIDYFKLGNAAINMSYSDELLEFARQINDRYSNVIVEVKETYPTKDIPKYEIAVRHVSSGLYTPLFVIHSIGKNPAHVLSAVGTGFSISLASSKFETALAHCVRSHGDYFEDTLRQVNTQLDNNDHVGKGLLLTEDFCFHSECDVKVTFQLLGKFDEFSRSAYTGKSVDIWMRPTKYVETPEQFRICNLSDFNCICNFQNRDSNGRLELLYAVTILKESSTAIHRFTEVYKYFPVTTPKNTEV